MPGFEPGETRNGREMLANVSRPLPVIIFCMPASLSPHDRFIHAVFRRLVLIRAVEQIGWCLLGGSLAGLLLWPVVIWRGESAEMLLGGVAVVCAMAAVAMIVRQWPTLMMAAGEADRQLDLADLLSTCLQLKSGHAQPVADVLSDAVLAAADARCRDLSPSQVVLNRLGARTWGGIGLSVALVIALAWIPIKAQRGEASTANAFSLMNSQAGLEKPTDLLSSSEPQSPRQSPSNVDPANDDDNRMMTSLQQPSDQASSPDDGYQSPKRNSATGHDSGASGGSARTDENPSPVPLSLQATAKSSASEKGAPAGGVGAEARAGISGSTNNSAGGESPPHLIPPWQGDGWPLARQHAQTAITNGSIPDDYRDLVRDYFDSSAVSK